MPVYYLYQLSVLKSRQINS